jgi:hypothetical protein
LSERKESGDGEKGLERSRSNAKEKGSLMMDSPCGAVGEGGMDGDKTSKGERVSRT